MCPSGSQVLSIDLPEHGERCSDKSFAPWDAVPELENLLTLAQSRWDHISLRATSLGAWFSLLAFAGRPLEQALLVSPVLDMERLIRGMMAGACVSEEELRARGEIPVEFGETLSWRYLQYAQTHPLVVWDTPTAILYPEHDALTSRETVEAFVRRFRCRLTVLENAQHWLHTPEELSALHRWESSSVLV